MANNTLDYFTDEGKPNIEALTARLNECLQGIDQEKTILELWRILVVWVRELEDTLKVENDESIELDDETAQLKDE